MRTIKFRGKSVDYGTWRYGSLIIHEDGSMAITGGANKFDSQLWSSQVHPESVGQWTGLVDRHGKEIFEGDVMVCRQYIGGNFIDYCIERGFVEMLHGAFGLHRKQGYYRPFKDWLEAYEYEIIGNIYENPELLK